MERALHISLRAIKPLEERLSHSLTSETPITERVALTSELLLARFPRLQHVTWLNDAAYFFPDIPANAGAWTPPSDVFPDSFVALDPVEHAKRNVFLLDHMAPSVSIIADRIGVTVEGISRYPDILTVFAYLHEMGHAWNFWAKMVKEGGSPKMAKALYVVRRQQQTHALPIPDLPPSRLVLMRQEDMNGLRELMDDHRERLDQMGIRTIDDLVQAQQVEYRNLPTEEAADRFAGYAIQIFWDHLGFPNDMLVS